VRIAYFTAGRTGAGHVVRGLAIERALTRAGFAGEYGMFGPWLPFPAVQRDNYHAVVIKPEEVLQPMRALVTDFALTLVKFAPDLLIVDMFWAPLRHILPLRGCECWLILRHCAPAWFIGPPQARFAAEQFDRIIAIEPLEHEVVRESIAPIVISNPDECRPRSALRERLGVPEGQRLVAVVHAGQAGECHRLAPPAEPDGAAIFNLFDTDALFPVAEWLPGADAVIAGAGYNTFWEAHWLGYAGRTSFTAFRRKMDDQEWRLDNCLGMPMHENGADVLARWIVGASAVR
jgi:hypothetical protein